MVCWYQLDPSKLSSGGPEGGQICTFNTYDNDQNIGPEYRIRIYEQNIGDTGDNSSEMLFWLCMRPHFVCFSPDDRVKVESGLQILAAPILVCFGNASQLEFPGGAPPLPS